MNDLVIARNVWKTYGVGATETVALRGVDLNIRQGELTLLVGPSGSGKTTLLSILGAILAPTKGDVFLRGRLISRLPDSELERARLLDIGFIFQGCNLIASLTARENVELVLRMKGQGKITARQQALTLLEKVGLADRQAALPRELSGGQCQRVAIARALASDPKIILADEPTSTLDGENGRVVMTLLREISVREERAVIVVTHDPRCYEFADRVVSLSDGRIAEDRRCVPPMEDRC